MSKAGDHDFKAGAEIIRSHYGGFFTPTLYGYFIFAQNRGTNINNYLNALADTFSGSAGDTRSRPALTRTTTTPRRFGRSRLPDATPSGSLIRTIGVHASVLFTTS